MEEKLDYNEMITRFLERNLDEDNLIILTNWINESYENRKLFDQYNEVWQLSNVALNEGHYNTDAGWNSLQMKISSNNPIADVKVRLINTNQLFIWRIAAVAAMLVSVLLTGLFAYKNYKTENNQLVTIQSPRGEKSKVILSDSTVVWLNSESQLTWSKDFEGNTRIVTLSGEGYFDVKKDPNRPFIVRTPNADVKVFGTRFNVCSYPDEQLTEATLEEGKIGVYIAGKTNPVAVTPGQRMVYDRISGEISLKQVDTDLYTSWKENKLKFDDALFGEVVKKLERWYDVKIILDKNLKYSERYTMTIKTESLREVLNRLQITTPMSYNINEEKVFIYPKK
ncbi:MAG TPA: FecR domain-containing protein [Prolixibacteraceae bacterium]|jgi:ferric-dicitrate binding protein FerR (iron transport regulator)